MPRALQVTFRGLLPSEGLVSMTAEHHDFLHGHYPELEECVALIESCQGEGRSATRALVRMGRAGSSERERGEAEDGDPHVALRGALLAVRAKLVLRGAGATAGGDAPSPSLGTGSSTATAQPAQQSEGAGVGTA